MQGYNFTRKEFACKCGCGFDVVDHELLNVLQDLREHFGARITITSGCRCYAHNAEVGGSEKSKHTLGIAADIVVHGVSPESVYLYLISKYDGYGIGLYSGWIHIDVRGVKARW